MMDWEWDWDLDAAAVEPMDPELAELVRELDARKIQRLACCLGWQAFWFALAVDCPLVRLPAVPHFDARSPWPTPPFFPPWRN
jgi:hypothetical protein